MTAAPTPIDVASRTAGAVCRIYVSGAGAYSTRRTTVDHAREIALNFTAEVVAASEPDAFPLVPFPAASPSVDLMVHAKRVNSIEVVRVSRSGGAQ